MNETQGLDYATSLAKRPLSKAAVASLILGLAAYPLAFVLGMLLFIVLVRMGILHIQPGWFAGLGEFAMIGSALFLAIEIAAVSLGIVGIKQRRVRRGYGLAVAGIVSATIWALGFVFLLAVR